jgi:cytochrome c553
MKPRAFSIAAASTLALAGCHQPAGTGAAPAASAAAAASAASAAVPSGPIIAPLAASAPGEAERSAGATLATQGGNGVAACASCHGPQGEGNAAAGFPRIAGQSYAYLLHQLQSYADDTRKHAVMAPIAKALSAAQRGQAAAYYASLAPAGAASAAAPGAASAAAGIARGAMLARTGDDTRLIQACANCHGPGGQGEGAAYPYLAGQHAGYLVNALAEWRDGSRNTDPSGQMPLIAKALGDADAQAVAAFYAQQPLPAAARDARPAPAAAPAPAASAVVSGPASGAQGQATQGVGSEQGAPLTGGAQGPGGGGGGSGSGSTGQPSGAATTGAQAPASGAR